MKISEVIRILDNLYPKDIASDFDAKVIGDFTCFYNDYDFKKAMICLDITDEVINEAITNDVNLIIVHHPIDIPDPGTSNFFLFPFSTIFEKSFKNKITVYCMHTNYDVGRYGICDSIVKLFNRKFDFEKSENYKNYFMRTFIVNQPTELFIKKVKKIFKCNKVILKGVYKDFINKASIIAGSGGHDYDVCKAYENKVDVHITGEIKHVSVLYASYSNIMLIEVPHNIERFGFYKLAELLNKMNIPTIESRIDTSPYKIV